MFRNVLVAMDLSPATEALVSALPGLRDLGTEQIGLIHVAKPFRDPVSQSIREVEKVRERLQRLADRLSEDGFEVRIDVPSGSASAEVVKAAESRDADLILVGTRSHTRIREAFVGSVAWDVVRRASKPVLLQRIEANRPDPEAALEAKGTGAPSHVIYPTDFSEAAERAFPLVLALAGQNVPSVTLVHVIGDSDGGAREEARERLQALADQVREAGAGDCRVIARVGTPYEEILNAGARDPHAMVVMATQGRGFLPEIVMGSVSRQVVRQASARVLLVPDGSSD